MGYVRYSHARVSASNPEALGTCDRCGFVYNHNDLRWQFDWQGPRLQNLRVLVCESCYDDPQEQKRSIIIPADPLPVMNARQDPYMFMGQSSSPDPTVSGSPNVITTESSLVIVTETSSQPLITEIGVTPTPTSSGFSSP